MDGRTEFEERCLSFGVTVIRLVRALNGSSLGQKSREQLVSSATSIGANVAEARSAQSKADFISKMEIALKETREADYWLSLLCRVSLGAAEEQQTALQECYQITAILVASVKTAKANATANAESRRQKLRAESREQN